MLQGVLKIQAPATSMATSIASWKLCNVTQNTSKAMLEIYLAEAPGRHSSVWRDGHQQLPLISPTVHPSHLGHSLAVLGIAHLAALCGRCLSGQTISISCLLVRTCRLKDTWFGSPKRPACLWCTSRKAHLSEYNGRGQPNFRWTSWPERRPTNLGRCIDGPGGWASAAAAPPSCAGQISQRRKSSRRTAGKNAGD